MLTAIIIAGDHVSMTTMVGANEAARILGVTKATLYAYVSRGLIERHTAVDGRTSLYPRDMVEGLAARGRTRAPIERPSIDVQISSSITQLDDDALRFRGHDAAELAGSSSFEAVATLLWTGTRPAEPPLFTADPIDGERCLSVVDAAAPVDPVTLLALATNAMSGRNSAPTGAEGGARLLGVAPTLLGGPVSGTIAQRLTRTYRPDATAELIRAVDTALMLLADHELATSTLAVRVACSVRADPFAALAAGLVTVSGPLHGGASSAAAQMLERVGDEGAAPVVGRYLDAGERLPGFGHTVYRRGDPRVAPLMQSVRNVPGGAQAVAAYDAVVAEAGRRIAHLPNVDLALGALLCAGGLPFDAPVFAIARIAGWAAHYDEEATERPVRFRGLTRFR
jgi:citrate synthase